MNGHRTELSLANAEKLRWPFYGTPSIPLGTSNFEVVDPFPCYPHDMDQVAITLSRCEAAWPAETPLLCTMAAYERPQRTNGMSCRTDYVYGENDEGLLSWLGHIFLDGKRVPPHPGTTRYVTAHEYGHHVAWWIAHRRGEFETDDLERDYAEMRDLPLKLTAEGGSWHEATGEIMACDFRIVVAGVEEEFWPHPGVEPPGRRVREWWKWQLAQITQPEPRSTWPL